MQAKKVTSQRDTQELIGFNFLCAEKTAYQRV